MVRVSNLVSMGVFGYTVAVVLLGLHNIPG